MKQNNFLVLFAALSFYLEQEEDPYQVAPVRPGGLFTARQLQSVRDGRMKCAAMRRHVLRTILPNALRARNNIYIFKVTMCKLPDGKADIFIRNPQLPAPAPADLFATLSFHLDEEKRPLSTKR